MKIRAIIFLLFASFAVGQTPTLHQTIDFMNDMLKDDGRQIAAQPAHSECEAVLISWQPVEAWSLDVTEDPWRWVVWGDSDLHAARASDFPRYSKFNFGVIDKTTVDYHISGFSSAYVKRFWDEHKNMCAKVDDRCKHEQLIIFDMKRSDIGMVGFKTSDLKSVIERGGVTKVEHPDNIEYQFKPNVTVEKLGLTFTSTDRASRFVTALKHAVELCGGKDSLFAPTPQR